MNTDILSKWRKAEDERQYTGRFNVAGVTYEGRQAACERVLSAMTEEGSAGVKVQLVPEPTNAHDPNAIKVYAVTPDVALEQLGYVPRDMAGMIGACLPLLKEAVVESVGRVSGSGPLGVRVRYTFDADKIRQAEKAKAAEKQAKEDSDDIPY